MGGGGEGHKRVAAGVAVVVLLWHFRLLRLNSYEVGDYEQATEPHPFELDSGKDS